MGGAALSSSPPLAGERQRGGSRRRKGKWRPLPALPRKRGRGNVPYTFRAIIICLISAIALAGLRLFGQALAQFMMVWQR